MLFTPEAVWIKQTCPPPPIARVSPEPPNVPMPQHAITPCSGDDIRAKRQRFQSGEASVEAYMAHLAAPPEPQQQLPLGGELDLSGGGAGLALRTRSMPFEDDLDDDTAGAAIGWITHLT